MPADKRGHSALGREEAAFYNTGVSGRKWKLNAAKKPRTCTFILTSLRNHQHLGGNHAHFYFNFPIIVPIKILRFIILKDSTFHSCCGFCCADKSAGFNPCPACVTRDLPPQRGRGAERDMQPAVQVYGAPRRRGLSPLL